MTDCVSRHDKYSQTQCSALSVPSNNNINSDYTIVQKSLNINNGNRQQVMLNKIKENIKNKNNANNDVNYQNELIYTNNETKEILSSN